MPRRFGLAAAVSALALCGTLLGPAAVASEPTGSDSNGRAILIACPDGYGGAEIATFPGQAEGDCDSLAEALNKAVNNGVPDDLILLRPGYYCPVNLPDTYGRLYLQGIPAAAFPAPGSVETRTRSDVESVTFASYASDSCVAPSNGAIIRAVNWDRLIFLSNLAVDGANDASGATGNATYGIELSQQNAYLRDVVVKRALTGLNAYGGMVSHSAFIDNVNVGIQTGDGRSSWIQDTLIAGSAVGLFEGTQVDYANNSSTLRNVTITHNTVGLGRPPSTYNGSTKIVNSLIAGNANDCDYSSAGQNSFSGHNAVSADCYGLGQTDGSVTLTSTEIDAIGAVNHIDGFEPYVDPGWTSGSHLGASASCGLTDQLERLRDECAIGAISPIVTVVAGPGSDPVSNHVAYPSSLDFVPVAPGETTGAMASLSNPAGRFVTVRDVQVSTGFTVARDDCSLSFLPRTWSTTGEAAQKYCSIAVTAEPLADMTGTLTVTTNYGVIAIPLSAHVLAPLQSATPTISGTVKVGSKLTAKPGAWTVGTSFTYQWKRSGVAISKATGVTYTPTASDRGKALSVTVSGTKNGYAPASKTSAAKTVAYGTLIATTPKITGTAKAGKTLTAVHGTWTAGTKAATLTYRWYANGTYISGATKKTLVLKSAQVGKKITVKVTGKASGYTTVAKSSAKTKAVTR